MTDKRQGGCKQKRHLTPGEVLTLPRMLMASLLTHTSDHVYFKDLRSCFLYISKAQSERYGLSDPVEAVGKTDFDFFTEEHARQAFDDEQEIIRTGRPMVAKAEKETWPDGRVTWVSTSKWPLHDEEGNIIGTMGISRDITAHKLAEEELQKAKDELERRVQERTAELSEAVARLEKYDRARSEFVANVSHELKTPLASLRFGISNLMRGVSGPPPDEIAQRLVVLNRECARMLKTVEDILDFSGLEAGALQLHRQKTPLGRLVRRSVETLHGHAQARKVEIRMAVPDGLGFVDCDPVKMERVVINIAGNAIKFAAGGTVELTLCRDPVRCDCLRLSVVDNGVGIAPHHMEKITTKFYRCGDHVSGTGLGLYLARQIVELHGGVIEIVSPPPQGEQGTMVTVTLHLAAPPTVLVIDGGQSGGRPLAGLLASHGYRLLECRGPDEGLEVARREQPDVVVVDYLAPSGSLGSLIAMMKHEDVLRSLPLLVVSDRPIDPVTHEILQRHGIPVLREMWQEGELLDALETALLNRAPRT
jgi:PAS domain S-box-containing protein